MSEKVDQFNYNQVFSTTKIHYFQQWWIGGHLDHHPEGLRALKELGLALTVSKLNRNKSKLTMLRSGQF